MCWRRYSLLSRDAFFARRLPPPFYPLLRVSPRATFFTPLRGSSLDAGDAMRGAAIRVALDAPNPHVAFFAYTEYAGHRYFDLVVRVEYVKHRAKPFYLLRVMIMTRGIIDELWGRAARAYLLEKWGIDIPGSARNLRQARRHLGRVAEAMRREYPDAEVEEV